jgi:hypothetical protein
LFYERAVTDFGILKTITNFHGYNGQKVL